MPTSSPWTTFPADGYGKTKTRRDKKSRKPNGVACHECKVFFKADKVTYPALMGRTDINHNGRVVPTLVCKSCYDLDQTLRALREKRAYTWPRLR